MRRSRLPGEPREFTFDVLVDGGAVRRDVPVLLDETRLRVQEVELPLDSVFWVSRRAGLVLLFSRGVTLALLGRSGDLEELARAVERGSDRAAQRSLLQPLAREVVVCTAGTAVSGTIGTERVAGLHLAVFTQRGLHLFAGSRSHSLEWPVRRVGRVETAAGKRGRGGLSLTGPEVSLTLRYLFPEEIQAVARVATRSPAPAAEREPALEMFAKGEVEPPPPAELPEFELSAGALRSACEAAAARVRVDPTLAGRFDGAFFERHFRDLGEMALGPLMLRRSAAAAAGSLARAVEALDAERLRDDAVAAFRAAANHLLDVYTGAVDALLAEHRVDGDDVLALRAGTEERDRIDATLGDIVRELDPVFVRALARQHLLLQRLQAREHAPPDVEDTAVEEAAAAWRKALLDLDRAYGSAWSDLLERMAGLWSDRFLPRLVQMAAMPARRLSEGARMAILATATFALVAALAIWLL